MTFAGLRVGRYLTSCFRGHGLNMLLKNQPLICGHMKRTLKRQATSNQNTLEGAKGLVYVSSSSDVHANLALEDWIYNNTDLSDTTLMILWRNDPCVVIGRHQNPWAEVNLRLLWSSNVKLARRRSGGGTVYHDMGNLNITFFSTRERYNRRDNLDLISRAIRTTWPHVSVSVSDRDDIVVDNFYKISGTSSKLGRKIAYHHCTLLHNANKQRLREMLHVSKEGLNSRATPSVHSKVKNLGDIDAAINHQSLIKSISNEFYEQYPPYRDRQLYEVDPADENTWKGISDMYKELKSWDWVYGKTPRFSVTEVRGAIKVIVHIHQAIIEGVVVEAPDGWLHIDQVQSFAEHMKGQYFWSERVAEAMTSYLSKAKVDNVETLRKYRLLSSMIRDAAS